MGFKQIKSEELISGYHPSFIGTPLQKGKRTIEAKKVRIDNEESINFIYDSSGKKKEIVGNGTIIIQNPSSNDNLWDVQLKLEELQSKNIKLDSVQKWKEIEHNDKKIVNYTFSEVVDFLKITEFSVISNMDNDDILEDDLTSLGDVEHLLILNKENNIKFTIIIENISSYLIQNIQLIKQIAEDFYGLASAYEIKLENNELKWKIPKLDPKEKKKLDFYLKINPTEIKDIGSGSIEIFGDIDSTESFSGLMIGNFSALSHTLQAIQKIEKEDEHDKFDYSLIFKNNSEFEIELNAISIWDELSKDIILDLRINKNIGPNKSYITETWEGIETINKNLAKQVDYSVNYEIKHFGKINIQIDENIFKVAAFLYEKSFTEKFLVQSSQLKMEESLIKNTIHVRNTGTSPISAIIIKERIPEDFLIPAGISKFQINHSTGKSLSDNFIVNVSQSDMDYINYYTLEISINLNNKTSQNLLDINENIEITYPLYIMSPDNAIEYKFPTEIVSYFSKFRDVKSEDSNNFYVSNYNLPIEFQPLLKVGEHRKELVMSKVITPKEASDEFNISIRISNTLREELKNISILDMFPKEFELISSNLANTNFEGVYNDYFELTFFKDSISPNQDFEINYQIKTKNGKTINYSDMEPFIYDVPKCYASTLVESTKDKELKITKKKIEIKNEEYLQFQYNNLGEIKSLSGSGNIIVFNNSLKEKLWNTEIELENSQILASEIDDHIRFDTIEPKTNKSMNYEVDSSVNIPDPLKITESINIVNLETQSINDFSSYLNPSKAKLISKKKAIIEKRRFNALVDGVTSKLASEKENLAGITKLINEEEIKKGGLNKITDNLKKESEDLMEEKTSILNKKIKTVSSKSDISYSDDLELVISEITKQIRNLNENKQVIEEEAHKKEIALNKELNNEFDPQIKGINRNLNSQKSNLDKTISTANEWTIKHNQLNKTVKSLRKQYNSLIKIKTKTLNKELKLLSGIKKDKLKEPTNQTPEKKARIVEENTRKAEAKTKEIEEKFKPDLEDINSKLEEMNSAFKNASKELDKWSNRKKELKTEVKEIQNEYDNLVKTKEKILNQKLMEFIPEKNKKVKQIENQIKSKENHIKTLKGIEDNYNRKIDETEANLSVEQGNLKDTSNRIDELTIKKNEIEKLLNNLEKEHEALHKEEYKYKDIEYLESLLKADAESTEISSLNERSILIFGEENRLEIKISIENNSPYQFQDLEVIKSISKEFFEIKSSDDIEFEDDELTWKIPILNPNETILLSYYAKIKPTKKEGIGTGEIKLSGKISSSTQALLSGLKIDKFSAFSHSLHEIFVRNNECAFILKNNSDFDININSVLVLDESQANRIIDIHPEESLSPGQNFISKSWEVETLDTKFLRKVDYTVDYNIQNSGYIEILIDEKYFEMIDLQFEKSFSELFMAQSSRLNLEESIIENFIRIENKGTSPIDGILIEEIIPADFILPLRKSDVIIKNSSGNAYNDNFEMNISPTDRDPSVPHTLRILINLNENIIDGLLGVNDYLNVYYPLSIFSPNELKKYDFQIEVKPFFSKFTDVKSKKIKSFYFTEYTLPDEAMPPVKVGHNRFEQEIRKTIRRAKRDNEFIINISIKNGSSINLKNLRILDVFPNSFELVSSNVKHEINSDMSIDEYWINFIIDKIEPNGTADIKYRIKNLTGQELDYSKIEPYIFT